MNQFIADPMAKLSTESLFYHREWHSSTNLEGPVMFLQAVRCRDGSSNQWQSAHVIGQHHRDFPQMTN